MSSQLDFPVPADIRTQDIETISWGISVSGLVKDYPGGIRAIDGINFDVKQGEIFGLLGPNGSGKTTTVEILTTLLSPTKGKASVAGCDVVRNAGKVRTRIGVALQEVALDPLLTAWDHLRLQGTLHGLSRRETGIRARDLVEKVGLSDAASRRTRTYSGGMKRRLDLALALLNRPRVLFLDEPTTGLDPHSRVAIWNEVRDLAREEGVTVFLTTQYLEEADELADKVAIIDKGRIVRQGSPNELKREVGDRSVVLSPGEQSARAAMTVLGQFGDTKESDDGTIRCQMPARQDLAGIIRALDAAGVDIDGLEVHAPTLDDVFFAETGRGMQQEHDV